MAGVDAETRERSFKICRCFLGGTWEDVTIDEFKIEHISGGLSNLLYCCSVASSVALRKGEVRKVMLRLYGKIIQDNPEMVVTDSVIFALLAEKGTGPKLYGVFTSGRVEEYIDSRHLMTSELWDPAVSVACARIMARFHKLCMPLCKQPTWLFSTMGRYLQDAQKNIACDFPDRDKMEKIRALRSYRLAEELEALRVILSHVDSPVVFCHNDLQEGNILLSKSGGKSWQLMPIDFEYASYNYRGFDIGNHFCEWCWDYSSTEPPYYSGSLKQWPTVDQQLLFIRAYLEASEEDGSGDYRQGDAAERAAIEADLLKELAAYALASHFLWALWAVVQAQISGIKFGYLDYAMARFEAYFTQKEIFLKSQQQVNGTSSVTIANAYSMSVSK